MQLLTFRNIWVDDFSEELKIKIVIQLIINKMLTLHIAFSVLCRFENIKDKVTNILLTNIFIFFMKSNAVFFINEFSLKRLIRENKKM